MTGRSAGTCLRRLGPPHRRYCALATFALFALCGVTAAEVSPDEPLPLQPAASAPDSPALPAMLDAAISSFKQGLITPPEDPQAGAAENTKAAPSSDGPADGKGSERDTDLITALERHGDLTLRNSTLDGALFTIGELWGINIVVGEVHGTVNGVFKDAPLREILDSILLSNGYSYRPVGKSLVVSPLSELGQTNPFYISATIPVRAGDIDEIVEGARLLSTPQGQVRAIKSARSIFVLDFPDRVQMIRDFVASIDGASQGGLAGGASNMIQPLQVGYFHTQHIEAKAAEQALQAVLSKDGRVGVLEKEDRLVVSDYAENLKMVAQVLQRLDRPRPQVRITALIYDLSLQDIEELGINWNGLSKSDFDANGDPQTLLGVESVLSDATDPTVTFSLLSKTFDLSAVALALQNANDARLLADPHVAVLDNEEAEFRSVSEIPYQQQTQTGTGPPIGTTAFKDAGISLRVRPKIAVDGTIRMEVTPEYSRLTGFTPGDNQPIIDTRTATTTLTVSNRQIVVIGGLRERRDVGDFKGVPYLKDVRWVGKLFRSRETDVRESELVVFIMPEIISFADQPNDRQQTVVDTIDYRLNQVPEAEGYPRPRCSPPACAATAAPGTAPNDSILPVPDSAASTGVAPAAVATGRLRRLPSVDGSAQPPLVATKPAELSGESPLPTPLRPDYDARFRDTDGIHRGDKPSAEQTAPPQPANKEPSFWERTRRV